MRATAAIPILATSAAIFVAVLAGAPCAVAEEGVESLPGVAVPDLRGMTMAEAFEALRKVGLTAGPVERTSLDVLARELRRHYAPGVVVEQLPIPFDGSSVRHVPVGSGVAMRVSSLASGTTLRPLVPGGSVPPPFDPTRLEWMRRPMEPHPTRPPTAPTPLATRTWTPPAEHFPAPATPCPAPQAPSLEPCPTPCDAWFVRAVGGYAFSYGTDSVGEGLYAGLDVGVRSSSGFGASLFYRYAESRVDWHHIGAKAEFETRPFLGGRLYLWTGLGVEYAWISGTTSSGDGVGGFAELGLGVVLSRSIRARLGANLHAVYTDAARRSPQDDWNRRWLWTLAPMLAVEVDF